MSQFKFGDEVTYTGTTDEQVHWGNNTDPRGILIEGEKYFVERVEVHSMHTKLHLLGIKGKFNSVSFEKL